MQRKELDGAAALTVLDAEQFKTSRISIYFILPSQRQTATAFALLPQLLERGYAGCPDMTALSRKLNVFRRGGRNAPRLFRRFGICSGIGVLRMTDSDRSR